MTSPSVWFLRMDWAGTFSTNILFGTRLDSPPRSRKLVASAQTWGEVASRTYWIERERFEFLLKDCLLAICSILIVAVLGVLVYTCGWWMEARQAVSSIEVNFYVTFLLVPIKVWVYAHLVIASSLSIVLGVELFRNLVSAARQNLSAKQMWPIVVKLFKDCRLVVAMLLSGSVLFQVSMWLVSFILHLVELPESRTKEIVLGAVSLLCGLLVCAVGYLSLYFHVKTFLQD